jgi:hypothetical protein
MLMDLQTIKSADEKKLDIDGEAQLLSIFK